LAAVPMQSSTSWWVVVAGLEVVGVVGGDEREAQVRRHLHELGVDLVLRRDAVALELEVEAVREDRREVLDEAPGAVRVAVEDGARHHRGQAAGRRDQALGVWRSRSRSMRGL
jgi:hypothetical protein